MEINFTKTSGDLIKEFGINRQYLYWLRHNRKVKCKHGIKLLPPLLREGIDFTFERSKILYRENLIIEKLRGKKFEKS